MLNYKLFLTVLVITVNYEAFLKAFQRFKLIISVSATFWLLTYIVQRVAKNFYYCSNHLTVFLFSMVASFFFDHLHAALTRFGFPRQPHSRSEEICFFSSTHMFQWIHLTSLKIPLAHTHTHTIRSVTTPICFLGAYVTGGWSGLGLTVMAPV